MGIAGISDRQIALWEFVQEMVQHLVDSPRAVEVSALPTDLSRLLVLNIAVAPEDMGKVIGRDGRTARALRTIVEAAAVKAGVRCELNIGGRG